MCSLANGLLKYYILYIQQIEPASFWLFFRGVSSFLDTAAFVVGKILHKTQILQEQRNCLPGNIFSEQYRPTVLLLLIFSI